MSTVTVLPAVELAELAECFPPASLGHVRARHGHPGVHEREWGFSRIRLCSLGARQWGRCVARHGSMDHTRTPHLTTRLLEARTGGPEVARSDEEELVAELPAVHGRATARAYRQSLELLAGFLETRSNSLCRASSARGCASSPPVHRLSDFGDRRSARRPGSGSRRPSSSR